MSFKQKPLAVAIALALINTASFAENNNELGAITIYGSRFQETIDQALPQTTIITATEIQKSGLTNVSEVLQKIGNVPTKTDLRGGNNVTIDLKGYGDTADNNVVVLLDSVRLSEDEGAPARISIIPIEAIDHIEIHKGGSSVLYGNGATSGYINIVTKKNLKDQTALSAGVGSYNSITSNAYTSKKVGDLNISAFGKTNNTDNYRNNNKDNEQSVGTIMQWSPSDKTTAGIKIFGNQEKSSQPGSLPSIYINTNPRQTQVPGYSSNYEFTSNNVTFFASTKIDQIEWGVDFNTRNKKTDWVYNYNASTVASYYYNGAYPTAWGNTSSSTTTDSFSPRAKISNFLIKENTLTIGYDWSRWNLRSNGTKNNTEVDDQGNDFRNAIGFLSKDATHKSEAIYVYDDWKITPVDRLIAGARRQHYEQSGMTTYGTTPAYTAYYRDFDYINNIPLSTYTGYSSNGSYGHSTKNYLNAYELQYSRKITSSLEPFIKKGRSFRLPTADDNAITNTFEPLRPQKSNDNEIGVKWATKETSLTVSLFKSYLTDEIIFVGGANKNQESTAREGFDITASHKINSYLSIRGNFQFINAEITEGANAGKKTPGVSRQIGSLGFDTNILPNQALSYSLRGASGHYASEDSSNNQPKSSGYLVSDLQYSIKESSWTWVARLNNIFDKHYYDTSIYKSFPYDAPYNMTVYPNPGRNFSLTGRYVF